MMGSFMARYVRRFSRVGHSLGPSEERGFAIWVGYDVEGMDDPAAYDLVDVDGWSDIQLEEIGVATFKRVTAEELKRWKS